MSLKLMDTSKSRGNAYILLPSMLIRRWNYTA